jgi:hypothetical protein
MQAVNSGHRSLEAWQEARTVVLGILSLCRDSWKPYAAALSPNYSEPRYRCSSTSLKGMLTANLLHLPGISRSLTGQPWKQASPAWAIKVEATRLAGLPLTAHLFRTRRPRLCASRLPCS